MGWKTNGPWEYLVVFLRLDDLEDTEAQLNEYGQSGWELVSTQVNSDAELAFFKRPVA